eukprot:TRINITY_DN10336_c0_g1_i1.p1 TRINITY_DN10336_c0_g1~~TRINITY_DN10336_c0_g1_i1.p1  ORF type:complete len:115 (+),score=14.52 TRINITY_DN10336_c0_g1_i1:7-351(+)
MSQDGVKLKFSLEEVNKIVKENVESVLVNQTYHPGKTTEWIDEINNKILQRLAEQQKSFKYVVNSVLMQKKESINNGLHVSSACLWDITTDGVCTYRWENKTILCITNVFGCMI